MKHDLHQHVTHASHDHACCAHKPVAALADPVCGMAVATESPHRHTHHGKDHFFCSTGCQHKFIADPDRYLVPAKAEAAVAGAIYTCPMHPEIRQDHPGTCPNAV